MCVKLSPEDLNGKMYIQKQICLYTFFFWMKKKKKKKTNLNNKNIGYHKW